MKKKLLYVSLGLTLAFSLASCDQISKYLPSSGSKGDENKTEMTETVAAATESQSTGAPSKLQARPYFTTFLDVITCHPQAGNSYTASNLFDGRSTTAWIVGAKEYNRSGKYSQPEVIIDFDGKELDFALISNGYAKSNKVYENNARVRGLTVYALDGNNTRLGTLYSGYLEDTKIPQTLQFAKIGQPYSRVAFTLDYNNIYYGDKFQDLCINEIELFGR